MPGKRECQWIFFAWNFEVKLWHLAKWKTISSYVKYYLLQLIVLIVRDRGTGEATASQNFRGFPDRKF